MVHVMLQPITGLSGVISGGKAENVGAGDKWQVSYGKQVFQASALFALVASMKTATIQYFCVDNNKIEKKYV